MHDAAAARLKAPPVLPIVVSCIPLLVWLYLLLGRGGFWRVSRHFAVAPVPLLKPKSVAIIIPARDEEPVIGETVASLLSQSFPSPLHLFVIDDNSSDGTADAARYASEALGKADALTVIKGQPLAAGWTGKLWAIEQGVREAEKRHPDYLLFTDADIRHDPESVSQLVGMAESNGYDLASFMAKLACRTPAEKSLIPAFVFFFLKLYPPAWIASKTRRTAGAAGGCILLRTSALNRIGGLQAIRGEIIDDCALARAVKNSGGRLWLGLTGSVQSTRPYGGFADVRDMISRTAFNQLRHSAIVLVGTLVGLCITYMLPVALIFSGKFIPAAIGFATFLIMTLTYLPMLRFYRSSPFWVFALPAIAAFYMGATIQSAVHYWRGQGGIWKGRIQDVPK